MGIISCDIKKLDDRAILPQQKYNSAGVDLYALEDEYVPRLDIRKIRTGLAIAIPHGFVGIIKDRSSLACKGLHCFAGVIDEDYRGEICVVLYALTLYKITAGDRIAQLLIQPVYTPVWHVVDELPPTTRGEGGFGSTGR